MAAVKFFTLLRLKLGISEVEVEADNITLKELIYRTKDAINDDLLIQSVLDDKGDLRRGTNILVNGQSVFRLNDINTIIKNDDVLGFFPVLDIRA